jgi:DNA-binding Xre family transcriptional regulator
MKYKLKIKELAARKGMDIREVALLCGLSPNTLYAMNSSQGTYNTRLSVIIKLMTTLDCAFEELVEIIPEDDKNVAKREDAWKKRIELNGMRQVLQEVSRLPTERQRVFLDGLTKMIQAFGAV